VKLDDSTLPVMLWYARPDMSCEYASRAWLEFTGTSAEQVLGEGLARVVHAEDLAPWLDTCVRAFDARAPFEIEYRMRRHDGEYRWVVDRGVPRYAPEGSPSGLFLGYAGVCIEIHERKLAEQSLARSLERERRRRTAADAASRGREAFFASVLGELHAPIRAVLTWAAHLREQLPAQSEAAEALEAIVANARVQYRIVDNLLELADIPSMERPCRRSPDAPLLAGVRVLVVEDEAQARELLLRVLRVAGAEARPAGSSAEALRVLDQWRPDIMLSDTGMRGDDGYVLIRAVRSLPAERGGCLRAAALMASADALTGSRAVAAGYDAQLAKPVEPVALLATVARLVQPA
jgi:PAS domain S-box-containing protein